MTARTRSIVACLSVGVLSVAAILAHAGQPSQPSRATGVLAGRVVDIAGDPVEGAVVSVRSGALGGPPALTATTGRATPVRTNSEGRFVFTDVPAGAFQVEAARPGWLTGAYGRTRPGGSSLPIDLADGAIRNDLTITMWRPAVIAGFVTADNGDPLVGAEVRAVQLTHAAGRRQMHLPQGRQAIARKITDDRGAYRFSDLVPGDYVIAVLASVLSEPPGFAGAIRAQGTTPRSYYQTMTAAGAAPIVFDRATGVAPGGRALVDSLTALSGVPATEGAWPTYPTTYHPSATTQTAATVVSAKSGEPQTAINIDVRLVPTFQVSGVLTGPEGPAPWHAVHLVPVDTGDAPLVDVSTAVTDADGTFTFYGVPPGQYSARVIRVPWPGAGMEMAIAGGTGAIPHVSTFSRGPIAGPPPPPTEPLLHASQSIVVEDRHIRNVSLTLAEGLRVRGRVVMEGTGPTPSPDQWRTAAVTLVPASGSQDTEMTPHPIAGEGLFTTPGAWPGRYLLSVNPPRGWTLVSATSQGRDISAIAFDLNADVENVVITLTSRSRTVKGSVQVESGFRPSDAVVLIFPVEQEAWVDYGRLGRRVMGVRVLQDGTFSLPALSDGEYHVVAIPDSESYDWQNPATLARLAGVADQIRMQGDGPPALSLRMKRIR